jgi:hypothetical protein
MSLEHACGDTSTVPSQAEGQIMIACVGVWDFEVTCLEIVQMYPADRLLLASALYALKSVPGQTSAGPLDEIFRRHIADDTELTDTDGIGQQTHGILLYDIDEIFTLARPDRQDSMSQRGHIL